ncbi:MAG: PQQ-dependent sugar dehydrogenase [Microscillaceae bacterium]|nr:PQQ-dependent sugar dehydrogenase [Microscillaceae bacterium]
MRFICTILLMVMLASCHHDLTFRKEKKVLYLFNPAEKDASYTQKIQAHLQELAKSESFRLDIRKSFEVLTEDSLLQYSAILMLNLPEAQLQPWHKTGVERYVQAGGGLFTIDSLHTRPYSWHWYQALLDAKNPIAKAGLEDSDLPKLFQTSKYDGGRIAKADIHKFDFQKADLKAELLKGLHFLMGDNAYNPMRMRSLPAPPESRFTQIVLDDDLYEPMQMTILPVSEQVLFTERRGKLKLYDPYAQKTKVVAEFNVCINGNYEDGLQGIAADPGYGRDNHWVYIYYSPSALCDNPYQYLSRFDFIGDSLYWNTEKVILKVKVQRETCCHSGGAVEFGPDGLLYLSTGDNTSSKESNGYTPIDERPGRGPFDAQKSSGNTQDLRGKILRIKPKPNGTYEIPHGNLFPKDGSQGRPEIYAMGCRNPFRISIDPRTNWVYWGDVGPDVGEPGRYGPQSYDEWNQAKTAGNFGWPYFVGNNFSYPDRDFATDEVGTLQVSSRPVNLSPHNYGAEILPPAQPAWIWYPYSESKEFPLLGTGSRSAMAGPFYQYEATLPSKVKFPEYYDGKFFVYEWARSWIKVFTLDKDGKLLQMEPFLDNISWSKPIDIKFGPDGAMYVLEYGNQYFMDNPDARLTKIVFAHGNREPIAKISMDKPNGSAPHKVKFSARASFDYDQGDSLRYEWYFGNMKKADAQGVDASYTFAKNGTYKVKLKVIDAQGSEGLAYATIQIGNNPPEVQIAWTGNRSFYFEQTQEVPYQIRIRDKEDESKEGIDPKQQTLTFTYIDDFEYLSNIIQGKEALPEGPLKYLKGKKLISGSDCFSCHQEEAPNIGPSYRQVAQRYQDDPQAVTILAQKIIKGGNGNWGEKIMAGHPQLSEADAQEMVRYILSLEEKSSIPLTGKMKLNRHQSDKSGAYLMAVGYRDQGAGGIEPLGSREVLILRPAKMQAEFADQISGGEKRRFGEKGENTMVQLFTGGSIAFKQVDLKGIAGVTIRLANRKEGTISLHLGSILGKKIAQAKLPPAAEERAWKELFIPFSAINSETDLYLVFTEKVIPEHNEAGEAEQNKVLDLDWVLFREVEQ